MSAPATPATLTDLLGDQCPDLSPEQLQWMLLTWDLAYVSAGTGPGRFVRFFLTTEQMFYIQGVRAPWHFMLRNPQLGEPLELIPPEFGPLEQAITATEGAIESGYQMLCRPLAVDCSAHTGGYPDGSAIHRPADLLQELHRQNVAGARLLRTINRTRMNALSTHAAPGWTQLSSTTAMRSLWLGKIPRALARPAS